MDPGPFTWRELLAMAQAKNQTDWNHTAALMCLLANCHRGQGQRVFQPADFHPDPPRKRKGGCMVDAKDFKKAFGKAR